MIAVLIRDGRDVPVAICDHCGEPIRDAELGMVALSQDTKDGKYKEIAFLHKGACDQNYNGGDFRDGGWVEISHFLARLCLNSGTNRKGFAEAHKAYETWRASGEPSVTLAP